MIGFLVRHRQLGLGKVIGIENRALRVQFLDNRQVHSFSPGGFKDGTLARERLSIGTLCGSPSGECVVSRIVPTTGEGGPLTYEVTTDSGENSIFEETVLTPATGQRAVDPLSRLVGYEPQEYGLFRGRQSLLRTYSRLLRNGAGFRALLASRVDLRPHQAFVAGTVVLDARRRYILADEVGLGKTIEAGLVIYDLLIQKPGARILVICPGALTNQWLSELFSKFGGQIFTLLDLRDPILISARDLRRTIVSMTLAGYRLSSQLEAIKWDMLVVDEAHHLLASPVLYDFVETLSSRTPSVLLLSAIPAHEREAELLRLLALLEPDRYKDPTPEEAARFVTLHGIQTQLGRRLRLLGRRIDGFEQGEFSGDDVLAMATRVLEVPVICEDEVLRTMLASAEQRGQELVKSLREFAHTVADRYRLNRRILRNRRQRLIEESQIVAIDRRVELLPYRPEQLEIDALDAIHRLLRDARDSGLETEVLTSFARTLLQSAVVPSITIELLLRLKAAKPKKTNERGRELVIMGHTTGYADWALYSEVLLWSVREYVSTPVINETLRYFEAWRRAQGPTERIRRLLSLLEAKSRESPLPKLLIFAGFPGFSGVIAEALGERFASEQITEFRADMEPESKEASVSRFRDDPQAWLLISDETGGEGRNFQFASEMIHFDTPWSAARLEQRIGRLDRLGRDQVRPDVISNVLYSDTSAEAGLIECYSEGLQVYTRSISGIEFGLRDVERMLITTAVDAGQEGLIACVEQVGKFAVQERADTDAEAVLDEASFERTAAARFRNVSQSSESDLRLEAAFIDYFKALTGGHGARELGEFNVRGVWRFRPEETRFGALPVDKKGQDLIVGDHDGTFRRTIAQQRPRLEFFSMGNPFFDAVIRSLTEHATGRVYAIECTAPKTPPWLGCEFVFVPTPKRTLVQDNPGLLNQAEAAFAPANPLHLFYSLDGELANHTSQLLGTRAGLTQRDKGITWWDLSESQLRQRLPHALDGQDWQDLLVGIHGSAVRAATERLSVDLAPKVAIETSRILEMRMVAERDLAQDEVEKLDVLLQAITQWHVMLDSVGLFSINGMLHIARR